MLLLIPGPLLEDELFGHEKGAFSGADTARAGKLELASGGTLVFDEIGEMPLDLQAKLLRVLQEKEFYRLGGNKSIKIDMKVISLTNKDLQKLVKENRFREDLYFRIASFVVEIPPLRERRDDIQTLINYFFEKFSLESRIYVGGFSHQAIAALQSYNWPGNVRELENEIKKLVNQSSNRDIIAFDQLKSDIKSYYTGLKGSALKDPEEERIKILALLKKNRWNKSEVAKQLNISRTALYKKMKKLNIE